mmetsp:Transcript_34915/g.98997  ORF Transcript_34915/g.98997 Transcript_34915/m.98997 type:complete len:232 (+) Transcript_34915:1626-2321(+)
MVHVEACITQQLLRQRPQAPICRLEGFVSVDTAQVEEEACQGEVVTSCGGRNLLCVVHVRQKQPEATLQPQAIVVAPVYNFGDQRVGKETTKMLLDRSSQSQTVHQVVVAAVRHLQEAHGPMVRPQGIVLAVKCKPLEASEVAAHVLQHGQRIHPRPPGRPAKIGVQWGPPTGGPLAAAGEISILLVCIPVIAKGGHQPPHCFLVRVRAAARQIGLIFGFAALSADALWCS